MRTPLPERPHHFLTLFHTPPGLDQRTKALAAAQTLVESVAAQRVASLEKATREAAQASSTGAAKHLAALLGRCVGRAAEASLLLSRLRFCCASLAESARKQAESTDLGMLDVAAEARTQRLTLQRQYDDTEGALRALLAEAAALRAEAAALDAQPSAAQATQLAAALAQLGAADAEFVAREHPQRIQPEVDSLEREVDVVMEAIEAALGLQVESPEPASDEGAPVAAVESSAVAQTVPAVAEAAEPPPLPVVDVPAVVSPPEASPKPKARKAKTTAVAPLVEAPSPASAAPSTSVEADAAAPAGKEDDDWGL